MKISFLFFLLFSFSYSASIFNGKCVDNFYTLDSSTLKIQYSNGGLSTVTESKAKIEELVSNLNQFELVDGICQKVDTSKYLGLTYEQYHYSMAIYGIFLSSLVAFAFIKAT